MTERRTVTLIPGDGIGPEVMGATVRVLEALNVPLQFEQGDAGRSERPLLNHIAVLVDSAEEHIEAADELGIEIDDVVDAPNTYAVFLRGPEAVRIEYVEHKPTFSLT